MVLLVALMALLTITSFNVHYNYSNVTVTLNYQLNDLQKLGVFLFGADHIEKELGKLINGSFSIERVDMNRAILVFNVTDFGTYVYFRGVKLNETLNMTLIFPDNSTLNVTSDEIPAVYLFR